jgi:hypothetical protein
MCDGYDQGICRAKYLRIRCMLLSALQRCTLPIMSIKLCFFFLFKNPVNIQWNCDIMVSLHGGGIYDVRSSWTVNSGSHSYKWGGVEIGQFLWRMRKRRTVARGGKTNEWEKCRWRNTMSIPVAAGLRCGSADCRLLWLRFRIPPGDWCVSCECCVFSGRGLCDGSITRPDESYRLSCVWVWSWSLDTEEALVHWGYCGIKKYGSNVTRGKKYEE